MPSLQYNNFDELLKNCEVNLVKFNLNSIRSKIAKGDMPIAAKVLWEKGDLEASFKVTMKYLKMVSYFQNVVGKDSIREFGNDYKGAVEMAEASKKILVELYEKKAKSSLVKEAPKAELKEKEETLGETISCTNLFGKVRCSEEKKRFLIMDARSEADFDASHINPAQFAVDIINVPDRIIELGKSAKYLENSLPRESAECWEKRETYERVITLDSNGLPGGKAATLRNILFNYDSIAYKNNILLLEDGFIRWNECYPWTLTNPLPTPPQLFSTPSSNFDISVFNFGILDVLDFGVDGNEAKPLFDRTKKPQISPYKSSIPTIDRSAKAAALKTYELAELLKKKDEEMKDILDMEKQRLQSEMNLREELRRQKEAQFDEERQNILIAEEEKLLQEIASLKINVLMKDEKINELETMIKGKMMQQKSLEEVNIETNINKHEEEAKRVKKECDNLENERMKQEARSRPKPNYSQRRPEINRNAKPKFDEIPIIGKVNKSLKHVLVLNRKHVVKPQRVEAHDPPRVYYFRILLPAFCESVMVLTIRYRNYFLGLLSLFRRTPGLTGLKNLGNTCYMNSILQCISNNPLLADYFTHHKYQNDLNKNQKTQGQVAEKVAGVVRTLWSGQNLAFACTEFKKTVGAIKSEYRTCEQQDSHEFLTFLMDWLHNDLRKETYSTDGKEKQSEMERAWENFIGKNHSFIASLFYGLQKSTVSCSKCDEQSATYEPFSNLSLNIPDGDSLRLLTCLDLYLKTEPISGWRCPKCKDQRQAEKKTEFCKLPEVLVIHLKRFSFLDIHSKKKTTFVDFPLDELNLDSNEERRTYSLYGVSNHYGTMEGGHYTAYCKNPIFKKWFKFDDHEVTQIAPREVVTNAAYILFYKAVF